jgi:hypothetical protein
MMVTLATLLPLLLRPQEIEDRPDVFPEFVRRLAPFILRHRHVAPFQKRLPTARSPPSPSAADASSAHRASRAAAAAAPRGNLLPFQYSTRHVRRYPADDRGTATATPGVHGVKRPRVMTSSQTTAELCLIEEDLAFRTLNAASARFGAIRQRAGGDSANVSRFPAARNCGRLGINWQPSGGCRA